MSMNGEYILITLEATFYFLTDRIQYISWFHNALEAIQISHNEKLVEARRFITQWLSWINQKLMGGEGMAIRRIHNISSLKRVFKNYMQVQDQSFIQKENIF